MSKMNRLMKLFYFIVQIVFLVPVILFNEKPFIIMTSAIAFSAFNLLAGFFLLLKKPKPIEKQDLISVETEEAQLVNLTDLEECKKKYEHLLRTWGLLTENLEKMYHKANEVNLVSILDFDIVAKIFQDIQKINGQTSEIKKNSSLIDNEITSIASFSTQIKDQTVKTSEKIHNTKSIMENIFSSNSQLKKSLDEFLTNTKNIEAILSNIGQITNKTRTLSINASIEASKVGAYGGGFAIIAKEVRNLAENTFKYTKDIQNVLANLKDNSSKVIQSMGINSQNIENGIQLIQDTSGYMTHFNDQIISIDQMIQNIKRNLEEEESNLDRIFSNVNNLKNNSDMSKNSSERMKSISEQLSHLGENSINTAIEFPSESKIFHLMQQGNILRKKLESEIESMVKKKEISERDLFEPVFTEIANTNPVRHNCQYTELFIKYIKPVLQEFKDSNPAIINVTLNDMKNYVATCCKEFDQPLTGKPEVDSKINFTRRIYNMPEVYKLNKAVEKSNFYLSSYAMPTFNVTISDLTFPLFLFGKRWGTGRIGFTPDKLK